MSAIPGFRHANVGGCLDATVDRRADGSVVLRSTEALRWYPPRLSDCLERYAQEAPERVFAAQRAGDGEWRELSYARMLDRARSIGQALVDLGLSADRPIAILSDNDLEHLSIMMGAMWAGVPTISISTAYSLVSVDHGKLRHIASITTPGAVYASGERFGDAIRAAFADDVTVILGDGALGDRPVLRFDELAATTPAAGVDAAHDATGPDTIVKFLFTSGSTRMPKGVVNTNEMLCANQQMIRQCLAFLADEPPVLVDWLPWSHTFGGNHNVGIALYNGGTLYIDEGKPTPALVGKTLRNLREVSPTVYFNVPKGYEEIALAMDHDDALRESLFRRVEVFMYAGAGLSQAVWDKFDAHGYSLNPGDKISSSEKFHADIEYVASFWRYRYWHNHADFYDLFGPTRRARKGDAYIVGYKYPLLFDGAQRMDIDLGLSYYTGLDTLPGNQNVDSQFKNLLSAVGELRYGYTEKSLGAVDQEKGYGWNLTGTLDYANDKVVPQFRAGFDFGVPLPIRHSSIWLFSSAGISGGKRENSLANWYFGAYGNNYVDDREVRRYRNYNSFPGFEIDELAGQNFVKTVLEWNLPPLRFANIGSPSFFLNAARPAVFASAMLVDLGNSEYRQNYYNLGTQVDLIFTVAHRRPLIFSFGYAQGFVDSKKYDTEWMLSLKIL